MNKYAFFVSEHNVIRYVVEAEDPTEAETLLNDWIDRHTDQVCYDMDKYANSEWDVDYDGETDEDLDVTRKWMDEESRI